MACERREVENNGDVESAPGGKPRLVGRCGTRTGAETNGVNTSGTSCIRFKCPVSSHVTSRSLSHESYALS